MTGVECASLSTYLYMNPKACSSKAIDKWIPCDMCTEWFHLICLGENVDTDDEFFCENCCSDVNGIVMKI